MTPPESEGSRRARPLATMVVRAANRDEDDELIMLGMAEYEDGSGNSLIFIVSREGEQDVELEMDAYCIVRRPRPRPTAG